VVYCLEHRPEDGRNKPKHVDEKTVNKTHNQYCSAFVGDLYIMDLINAR
jgi:hypothetical protein